MTFERIMLTCALLLQVASTFAAPAIEIDKVERTNTGMTIHGSTSVLPPGTKIWATSVKFNGKRIGDALVLKDTIQAGSHPALLKLKVAISAIQHKFASPSHVALALTP